MVYSLIGSAKLNRLGPESYLRDVRAPHCGSPANRISELCRGKSMDSWPPPQPNSLPCFRLDGIASYRCGGEFSSVGTCTLRTLSDNGVAVLLFLGILGVVYPSSQSPEMQLSAVLDRQQRTVSVVLRNAGGHSYLVTMGAHLGRFCASAFRFAIQGEQIGRDAVQTSCGEAVDDPGVIGGRFESWVTFLPPGARYGMTFPLDGLRLRHNMHTSLADLMKKQWKLTVSYIRSLDENYILEWQSFPQERALWVRVVQTGSVLDRDSAGQHLKQSLTRPSAQCNFSTRKRPWSQADAYLIK